MCIYTLNSFNLKLSSNIFIANAVVVAMYVLMACTSKSNYRIVYQVECAKNGLLILERECDLIKNKDDTLRPKGPKLLPKIVDMQDMN